MSNTASSAESLVDLAGTIAVTSLGAGQLRLYYQPFKSATVIEAQRNHGIWTKGHSLCEAIEASPLAAINWRSGKQIHVYYLGLQSVLQELIYFQETGIWAAGTLGKMQLKAAPNTSIAALCLGDTSGSTDPHIRVYYQGIDSDAIKQIEWNSPEGGWTRPQDLTSALSGTSITAVVFDTNRVRIYYQTHDATLQEYLYDGRWAPGRSFGPVPGRTPIAAAGWRDGTAVAMNVFWLDEVQRLARTYLTTVWHTAEVIWPESISSGLAAANWQDDDEFMFAVYYLTNNGHVQELRLGWQSTEIVA